ncbi:MAG: YicC family protein [Bacteroidaceae bacterium]|nr:YicC family protein [Bacteroidaceae bacterium]MBR4967419.1 YicC family protein [Bacteroidaceae bacterium]
MIYSMTGYGKSVAIFQDRKICVEIRSLNGKAMDLSTRIAPQFKGREMEIRTLITTELERGKVDFALWVEQGEKADMPSINQAVVQGYVEQMTEIARNTGLSMPQNLFEVIVRLPEVIARKELYEVSDEEWAVVLEAIKSAIQDLMAFRKQEGEALTAKFQSKISNISQLLASVEPFEMERVEKIRARIEESLAKFAGVDYDRNRLEQELIFYIEKLDVNEEKQRLANHLQYFLSTMDEERGQGKKLGFIAQEMGREINTLGSKSNHAEMQRIVVRMKDELEQIKEQVLNVM